MVTVQFLGDADAIDGEDWCRPLELEAMSGGMSDGYSFKSAYSGLPENNVKWVKAKQILGKCWMGSTVSELKREGLDYEFVRGSVPVGHRLNMKHYNDLTKER